MPVILVRGRGHVSILKRGSGAKRRPCHDTGCILRLYDQLLTNINKEVKKMSIAIEQNAIESNGQLTKDSLRVFLDFWASPPRGVQDDAQKLHARYTAAQSALGDCRRRTAEYLVPANHGKGWHPVFDPDLIEEVTSLTGEIERRRAELKSVTQDIVDFMAVAGGPLLQPLVNERQNVKSRLQYSVHINKAVVNRASNLNPRLSPAEVQELVDVVEANGKLSVARLEFEPRIQELTTRMERARAILGRA
jgi:hypothetical protein